MQIKTLRNSIFIIAVILLAAGCRKKAFDDYYGRPDNLAAPIYQQLQARGNFKAFIACIDKAGYKATLSAAGYWTLFAPNDDAFQKFLTERGLTDIAQLDTGTCTKIVTYSLVYNAYAKNRIGDYQSTAPAATAGWVPNMAFKRRTANYTGFYDDTTLAGQKVKALGSNRTPSLNGSSFILGDNNNKHIPYFVNNFFTAKGLTAADYNYFYPTTPYTGFNVVNASVVTSDIVAENGFIHEIDKVILPLPSIDKYLSTNPQYSEFKKLFDKYIVAFILNAEATNRYKLLSGATENVYIKTFNPAPSILAYSPNNENYLKVQDNDAQADGWTMFAPKNDVLLSYINTVLLENYPSLDQLPLQIIVDFLNAHMWQTTVWPTKFASTNNVQNEPAKFDRNTDIIDKQILSNGFFYGTNKVQQANVFTTVYGRPYLDPKYLLMTRALDLNYRYIITVPTLKFTVIMMSDALLRAKGYDFSSTLNAWTYTAPGTTALTSGNAPRDNLQRILAMHIIPTPNGELDNLAGSGIIETVNGEYIKWNAGKFTSAGTQETNSPVTATGTKTSSNGRVYYADSLLTYSTANLGTSINRLAPSTPTQDTTSEFYYFSMLLKNSGIFTPATSDISGVTPGVFYTVFIPNKAAIRAAAVAGLIPKLANGAPNYAPGVGTNPAWSIAGKDSVNNFIRYHILNKNTVVPDGKKAGTYETLLKKPNGDPAYVRIANAPNVMSITDDYGRVSNVVVPNSNNLADRAVIHLINNYLSYQ
jgi:uncharacterized surface protein with fasciclin (FAS1) repeats